VTELGTGRPLRVLWMIKGLGPGGAERLLVSMAADIDRDAVALEAAYLIPHKDQLVPELKAAGVVTHCLEGTRLSDPRWIARLRRLVRNGHYDIVHIHSPAVAALARPALRFQTGRSRPRLVYTEHNLWPSYGVPTRWANRLTYGLDDLHLAVSDSVKESVSRRWRPSVEVIVHGVPVAAVARRAAERDEVRAELGFGPDDVVAGIVANHRADKDYPTLLRAAAQIPGVSFVAVGQGPLTAQIEADHRALGLGDRFRLLGYRPDALRVMAAFDIFTLSSTAEGYPVALMESLALGLPVVATAVGGVVDAIRPGIEGDLVPAGRPDLLAAAIERLATDPSRRSLMADACRLRAQDFDIQRAAARTGAVYQSLAGSGTVELGTEVDVAAAAALHASEITEGFLPTLGPTFLRRLYRRIVRWDGSFLLVIRDDDGVAGMAAATEDVGRLYRAFLVRDGIVAGIAAAPRLMRSWRKVLETLRYPAGERELPRSELLAVAVSPRARGRGIGRQLVLAVTDELTRRGVTNARVVAGTGNAPALRLYSSAGYRPAAQIEVHEGVGSQVLTWR
jgi:glycosyltransferase involved in cell wall biosynthesis/ribosomal protein S18 acetylase RimI-like enzyme